MDKRGALIVAVIIISIAGFFFVEPTFSEVRSGPDFAERQPPKDEFVMAIPELIGCPADVAASLNCPCQQKCDKICPLDIFGESSGSCPIPTYYGCTPKQSCQDIATELGTSLSQVPCCGAKCFDKRGDDNRPNTNDDKECCAGEIYKVEEKECCGQDSVSRPACCAYTVWTVPDSQLPFPNIEFVFYQKNVQPPNTCTLKMNPTTASCLGFTHGQAVTKEQLKQKTTQTPTSTCDCALAHEYVHHEQESDGIPPKRLCEEETEAFQKEKSCLLSLQQNCVGDSCDEINNRLINADKSLQLFGCLCQVPEGQSISAGQCDACMANTVMPQYKRGACQYYCREYGNSPVHTYCANY